MTEEIKGVMKTFENEWVNFAYFALSAGIMAVLAIFPDALAVKEIGMMLVGVAVTKIKGTP